MFLFKTSGKNKLIKPVLGVAGPNLSVQVSLSRAQHSTYSNLPRDLREKHFPLGKSLSKKEPLSRVPCQKRGARRKPHARFTIPRYERIENWDLLHGWGLVQGFPGVHFLLPCISHSRIPEKAIQVYISRFQYVQKLNEECNKFHWECYSFVPYSTRVMACLSELEKILHMVILFCWCNIRRTWRLIASWIFHGSIQPLYNGGHATEAWSLAMWRIDWHCLRFEATHLVADRSKISRLQAIAFEEMRRSEILLGLFWISSVLLAWLIQWWY
jgi:hypothetical protein